MPKPPLEMRAPLGLEELLELVSRAGLVEPEAT